MFKRLLVLIGISTFFVAHASAEMPLQEKEYKLVKTFVTSAVYLALYTDSSDFKLYNIDHIQLPKISAQTIADDFDENNLAAEKKYKNIIFEMTGKVVSVDGNAKEITVTLNTSNFKHGDMDAILDSIYKENAATYKKGDEITLDCRGVDYDMIATAQGCEPSDASIIRSGMIADVITKAFLNGEDINKFITKKNGDTLAPAIFVKKYSAQFAPDNSPCLDIQTVGKCNYADFVPNNGKASTTPEFKKAYLQEKERYHLP